MDDGLKQRLVGAIVLLALAVIFVPVLFDRERMEPIDTQTQIPPPPKIEVVELPKPSAPDWIEPAPEPQTMFAPDEQQAVLPESEPAAERAIGEGRSWVLQVASFRSDDHANSLHQRLVDLGYPAYIKKVSFKNGDIIRVYVGPKLDKSALQEMKEAIDQQLKVDSMLLEFKSG